MSHLRASMAGEVVDHYWVPDTTRAWVPCVLKSVTGEQAQFDTEDGRVLHFPAARLQELHRVEESQLMGVADICSLAAVSEGAMLHTVRIRYLQSMIYTNVSRVLIAINPFGALPIYSSEHLDRYAAASEFSALPPHIFGLTQDALRGIRQDKRDHVILISGESGAGKTESAKLILSFVAEATRAESGGIEEKILQTSPIFESFGNAMTVRNNNSSRFGKWLDIRFSSAMKIRDCMLTNYLLETTRVCTSRKGDRSYHIFYQLLQARHELPYLDLGELTSYRYLNAGEHTAPGIDDAQNFEETREAFTALGVGGNTIQEIFRLVAGVLTLGNCEFRNNDNDESCLLDASPADRAASLLGVELEALRSLMLQKRLVVAGSEIEAHLREDQSFAVRDTLAQLMYGRLFEWLVQRMNIALNSEGPSAADDRTLGVLDIAGFECFEKNSLEQLLINLSNEHLQQSFNSTIVKSELEDYAKEGVDLRIDINFTDNTDCLELIDGKSGILEMLDEEGNLPKGSDMNYANKVLKAHGKHARLLTPKFGGKAVFGVRHFAGEVFYTCDGFLSKNSQKLPDGAAALLSNSKLDLLKEMGASMQNEGASEAESRARTIRTVKKSQSSSKGFRMSLRSLVTKISEAERHYIRCVKPNKEKKPLMFDAPMVMEQLLYSGVLEAVHVRQQGFSVRMLHQDFVRRYRCIIELLGKNNKTRTTDAKELLESIQQILGSSLQKDTVAVGKSKVLAKTSAADELDKGRARALERFATLLQARCRGIAARAHAGKMADLHRRIVDKLKAVGAYQAESKSLALQPGSAVERIGSAGSAQELLQALEKLLQEAAKLPLRNKAVQISEQICRQIGQELEVIAENDGLATSLDPVAIEKSLARTRGLDLSEPAELVRRWKRLQVQLPLVHALEVALASATVHDDEYEEADDQLREAVKAVEAAGLRAKPEEWVPELGGSELFFQVLKRCEAEEAARAQRRLEEQRRREEEERKRREEEEAKQRLAEQQILAEQRAREQKETERKLAEQREKEQKEALRAFVKHERERTESRDVQISAPAEERQDQAKQAPVLKRPSTRKSARKSRVTITGLSEEDQQGILDGLRAAAEEFDCARLEELLRQASKHDISPNSLMTSRLIFEQLQVERFVIDALAEAEKEAGQPKASAKAVRRLQNLSAQIQRLQGDEERSREARRSVVAAARRRSISSVELPENLQLPENFYDLSDYAGLKPSRLWMGHRRTVAADAAPSPIVDGHMLHHSKVTISEALTRIPDTQEGRSVQIFRDILIWMADRPAQDCQRQAARDAVIDLARTNNELRDEVYVQILKQLHENPSIRSAKYGWQLLQLVCTSAAPSDEIVEYVRAFLQKVIEKKATAVQDKLTEDANFEQFRAQELLSAKKCLESLESLDALPRLTGHLWKKSPTSLRFRLRAYDWRYFKVRNMQLFWWRSAEDAAAPQSAGPDGGPLCKGFVNFSDNECEVQLEPSNPAAFTLHAQGSTASTMDSVKKQGGARVFVFDATGSEHTREEWVSVFQEHIARASLLRLQCEACRVGISFFGPALGARLSVPDISELPATDSSASASQQVWPAWENAPDLSEPKAGDSVWFKCQTNSLPDGSKLVYGAQGEILQLQPKGDDSTSMVTVRFGSLKYNMSLTVHELSRVQPPAVLAGGWRTGDVAWYVGDLNELKDGSHVTYGTQGEIMGPSTLRDNTDSRRVAVRFPGIEMSVSCWLSDISREQPSEILAGGWRVGETAWYKGAYNSFADADAGKLVYGLQGEIVGPDGKDATRITLRFQEIDFLVTCFLVDLTRENPSEGQIKAVGSFQVGQSAWYKGGRIVCPDAGELLHGCEGQIVGPSSVGDGEDEKRVAIRFPGIKPLLNIWISDLSSEHPVS